MKKQIQIKICPDGKVEAKTIGITGAKCLNYIANLETLLEANTLTSEYTDDYYLSETITDELTIQERGQLL